MKKSFITSGPEIIASHRMTKLKQSTKVKKTPDKMARRVATKPLFLHRIR